MKCPKCGSEVRDIARFCRRCHATLRYECPSCRHEQRHGGTCDKCGVNFLKYVTAVVSARQAEADVIHERIERRSSLLANVLVLPFTVGIPLMRKFLATKSKKGGS
jgi:Double zinc ribbon